MIQEDLGLPTCQATLGRLIAEAQRAAEEPSKDRSTELAKLIGHPASPFFTLIEGTVGFGLSEAVRVALLAANGQISRVLTSSGQCKSDDMDQKKMRVAIQGCGAVGSSLAYYLVTRGIARVVAMSDKDGIIHDQKGLDIIRLLKIRSTRKTQLSQSAASESSTSYPHSLNARNEC